MKRRIRNDYQRESSSLSSKKRRQESRVNHKFLMEEACEICGSVVKPGLMMICFKCRDTHEHTYCARVFLPSVPLIWICEACRFSSSRVLLISGVTENQMDSETTRSLDPKISHSSGVDDDHETTMLRSNEIEEVVGSEISANVGSVIHLPLQPHTSPLAKETSSILNDSSQDNEQQHQPAQTFPKKRKTFQLMGKHITL